MEDNNLQKKHNETAHDQPLSAAENKAAEPVVQGEKLALDDARRVKVLSPNQLVWKRFTRNRLAIVGSIFIALMFVFSFVGGWVSPYGEREVFGTTEVRMQNYASLMKNTELRYVVKEGDSFDSAARAKFIGAIGKKLTVFDSKDNSYSYKKYDDSLYVISALSKVGSGLRTGKTVALSLEKDAEISDASAFQKAFNDAVDKTADTFSFKGSEYVIKAGSKFIDVFTPREIAIATINVFNFASADSKTSFGLMLEASQAWKENKTKFAADGQDYTLKVHEDEIEIYASGAAEVYATLSPYVIQSAQGNEFIPLRVKMELKKAVQQELKETEISLDGVERRFLIERENLRWNVRADRGVHVALAFASPSWSHPLGTDGNGMDVMTRLMYGGRVSLLIGIIVALMSAVLGSILGGISGYFGTWVDNLIMRIVDIFYCIPSTPIIIIFGAVMDEMRVEPQKRMIYLMLVLGFLGWPAIARMVRGQILSLREQEFMLATEATGLRVSKRIFKHLIPNVMPQLIVLTTMSIGSTILIESVLSFLGLGVKYPFASWGNIINAVSNVYVMSNYLFVWIPAGLCILITVLGFNFIGDGLRDAYDPKMNR